VLGPLCSLRFQLGLGSFDLDWAVRFVGSMHTAVCFPTGVLGLPGLARERRCARTVDLIINGPGEMKGG
jgi:hypothetical protein